METPKKNTPWACLKKGSVSFRVPIDWVYSTRKLDIDCKQNKI